MVRRLAHRARPAAVSDGRCRSGVAARALLRFTCQTATLTSSRPAIAGGIVISTKVGRLQRDANL
jgi:hypothetical protein